MESGLSFASGTEYDNLYYFCEVLGRYVEDLSAISKELFGKDFYSYSTFTKEQWNSDLEGIIDKDKLPDQPAVFDPEEGIRIIERMKSDIQADPKHYKNHFQYYDKLNDYKSVLVDLDKVNELLYQIKKENKKWYIHIIPEL